MKKINKKAWICLLTGLLFAVLGIGGLTRYYIAAAKGLPCVNWAKGWAVESLIAVVLVSLGIYFSSSFYNSRAGKGSFVELYGWTRENVEQDLLRYLEDRHMALLFGECAVIILYFLFRRPLSDLLADTIADECVLIAMVFLLRLHAVMAKQSRKYLRLVKAGEFGMYTDVCIGKKMETVVEHSAPGESDIKEEYYLFFRHERHEKWEYRIKVGKKRYESIFEGDKVHCVFLKGRSLPYLVYNIDNHLVYLEM